MKNPLRLLSPIVFLSLLSTAGTAYASDGKTHMPSFCREQSGTATFGSSGEIFNASTTQSLTVECPIVRDSLSDPLYKIELIVRDRNLNDDISCRVRVRAPSGGTSTSSFYSTSGADAAGDFDDLLMLVELWAMGLPFNPGADSSMMLTCTLPPAASSASSDRSALFSYLVLEAS